MSSKRGKTSGFKSTLYMLVCVIVRDHWLRVGKKGGRERRNVTEGASARDCFFQKQKKKMTEERIKQQQL